MIALVVVVGLLAGVAVWRLLGGDADRPPATDQLPELALSRPDGTPVTLAHTDGRPMVINFFVSWCAPCIVEMPHFEAVHRELGDTVTVLGIASTDTDAGARSVVERTRVTYDTLRDPDGAAMITLRLPIFPSTVFVDADGNIVERHLGPLTGDELRSLIDEHLLS